MATLVFPQLPRDVAVLTPTSQQECSGAELPKEQEWAPNAYVGVARLVASRSPETTWEKGRHNSQPELGAQQLLERERVAPLVATTTTTTLCDSCRIMGSSRDHLG